MAYEARKTSTPCGTVWQLWIAYMVSPAVMLVLL